MTRCEWDSGSATGCRPLCDAAATRTLTYPGYGGLLTSLLCARHAPLLAARVHPYPVTDITDQTRTTPTTPALVGSL